MGFQEIENALKKEEQWTRSTAAGYTLAAFETLDGYLESMDEDEQSEARALCDTHLSEREKNSIIAMYISGSIQLERRGGDDYLQLLTLIEIFVEAKKHEIVEMLCKKILNRSENKHALRLLASSYEATGRQDEKFALWQRLVKVDYEEVEIVRLLAVHAQEQKDLEGAASFYKKAIHRLIKRRDISTVRSVFHALLSLGVEKFGYFMGVVEQVASESQSTAVALLRELEGSFKDDVDTLIEIQKQMLILDGDDTVARDSLVKSYKLKYKDHSRLKSCLDSSHLTSSFSRDIIYAIEDFETNIAFDRGTFVFQNSTNRIGRIRSIDENDVIVDFAGQTTKQGSRLSTNMAFKSLQALDRGHIWVLKSVLPRERLTEKIADDIPWTLMTVMKSFDGKINLKELKAELVPSILAARQWTSWLSKAKKELMTNPLFDLSANETDTYLLRSTPVSYEEKQLSVFRGEKDIYDKIKCLKDFITSKGDVESDFFFEMVRYFSDMFFEENGAYKPIVDVTDATFSAYLLLKDLVVRQNMNFLSWPENLAFATLFERAEGIGEIFGAIKDSEIKKSFIDHVVAEVPSWAKVLPDLFPSYLTGYIPDIYRHHKKNGELAKIYKDAVENFKEKSSTLLYLLKSGDPKLWAKGGVTGEQLLFAELQLLDYANRLIENRKDVTENRKISKTLMTLLFDEKAIFSYIDEGKEEHAQKVYSLVANVFGLPGGRKIEVKHAISERFPTFRFFDETASPEKDGWVPTGLFCSQASLDAKKREAEHIQHVELPEVAREIGNAREMGDLRENSEYKFGKEKQTLLSNTLRRLSEEIDRATVITRDKVDPTRIGFGTHVVLTDHKKGGEVVYTIMGPWESNPDENIINISAPFGRSLVNRQEGERFSFTLNEIEYDFTVEKISVTDF
ncbi:MAG: transcription elongation factor GreA [Sphaerochaeta sp.]|jgi:transcription elongation factor GreA-like protein/transcription elongation GreA/GreB family factor|nr:transcription elongation factor GreA [Sphaerochaeta sp.]MDX9915262.1 transcription elongation factor GreA [Sphaerochaeta sp.]